MSPRKRRLSEKFRSLYLWHRYAGLAAAVLAAWLAITGLFLNHSDDFALDELHVEQQWLLDWYGITPPRQLQGMPIDGRWLTSVDGRVYLDETFIAQGEAVGGAPFEDGFVVAFADRLHLFAPDGQLIETLPFTASAFPLVAIAAHTDGLLLTTTGEQFIADDALLTFTEYKGAPTEPRERPQAIPAEIEASIARDVLLHSLTWERVILDLHAGRLLGTTGRWLADIAAVLLLLLAASGVIVWAQRAGARRRHR